MTDPTDPRNDMDPTEVNKRVAAHARKEEADEPHRGIPLKWFIIVLVLACIGFAILGSLGQRATDSANRKQKHIEAVNSTATAAAKQADDLASQVQAACKVSGAAHDALTKLGACAQANDVKSSPAAKTSKPPRRVSAVAIVNRDLVVTYNDGTTANLGVVVGKSGEIGATGTSGSSGKSGASGKPGGKGEQGSAGKGIVTASPNANGHLIVTYTDGSRTDAGEVVGPSGKDGKNGVSVTSMNVTDSYHLIVTYSNGSSADIGALPPGPTGPVGPQGSKGDQGDQGSKGDPGSAGPSGPSGPSGATGPAGADGSNGKDAYPFTFTFVSGGTQYSCTITDPSDPGTCTEVPSSPTSSPEPSSTSAGTP